jgi:membrane protease YdiL (CAAX protease family)
LETSLQNGSPTRKPWPPYALTALMLMVFILGFRFVATHTQSRTRGFESETKNVLSGDWYVKCYFLQKYVEDKGYAKSGREYKVLFDAYKAYGEALADKNPSPNVIRRAIALNCSVRGIGSPKILDKIDAPETLKGLSKQDASMLRQEAVMWHEIYTDNVNPAKVDQYAKRIREVKMGPTESLALAQLYLNSGNDKLAKKELRVASARATKSVPLLLVVTGLMVLAGLVGIVLIILMIVYWNRLFVHSKVEKPDAVPSDSLFKGFSIYIAIMILVQVGASYLLAPIMEKASSPHRLVFYAYLISLSTGVGGILTTVLFRSTLHHAGGTLKSVGFSAKDFSKNVLWGFAGYCVTLPLLGLGAAVSYLLSKTLLKGIETPDNPVTKLFTSSNSMVIVLAIVSASVFAPLFEELYFRGALYKGLRSHLGIAGSVLISGIAFAVLHPLPAAFFPIMAIGVVFALLAESRQSLVPSIAAHALHNTVLFLMLYLITM